MIRYAHTNIISLNWKKLVDFYVKVFDCEIIPPIRKQSGKWLEKGTGVKNASLQGAHLLLPGHGKNGPTLEIYQYENSENREATMPNQKGFGHIAFEVNNVEEILKNIELNGGNRLGEITKKEVQNVGEITFIYVRDPEDNLIELQSWRKNKI